MKRFKAGIAVIGVLLSFFLISGGIVQAEQGVNKDEILIGSTMDLSGPIAFMGQSMMEGLNLSFKYFNDQGGINGRKIRLLVEDDGFQSSRSVLAAKKLVTKDEVFCMVQNIGALNISAQLPILEGYGVPLLYAGTPSEALAYPPKKYIFIGDSGYGTQGAVMMKYIVETLKVRKPKIAVLVLEEQAGTQLFNGVKDACAKYGITDILQLNHKRGAVDFSSQMSICKKEGVTHVIVLSNIREPAFIMKEAQRIQYKATYFLTNGSFGLKVLELAGDALSHTHGVYVASGVSDINTEDTKGFRLYKEARDKYKVKVDNTSTYYSFGVGLLVGEVLKRAGKDLTREGLIKAAETMNNYDNGILNPITWSPDRRDGGRSIKLFKAVDQKWAPATGWVSR